MIWGTKAGRNLKLDCVMLSHKIKNLKHVQGHLEKFKTTIQYLKVLESVQWKQM